MRRVQAAQAWRCPANQPVPCATIVTEMAAAGWHRRGGMEDGVMHGDAGGSEGDSRLREVYSRRKNRFVVEVSLAHVAPVLTSTFGI